MDLYNYSCYKKFIQETVRKRKQLNPKFNLKQMAQFVPVQYTYLSKALNDEATHLNEDHLFRVSQFLKLQGNDVDYLLLLRSHATCGDSNRNLFLQAKIEACQREQKLRAKEMENLGKKLSEEVAYLLDPLCTIVHMALHLPAYQENFEALCYQLSIDRGRLLNILEILKANKFIDLAYDEEGVRIKKVYPCHIHYGKNHPLMRTHQHLHKTAINSRIPHTDENEKHSFLATFNLAHSDYEKIKTKFKQFVREVESEVNQSTSQGVYQLSFDFLKWL